jgi:tRNA1Val (adenine37-N6)-methyltransferase
VASSSAREDETIDGLLRDRIRVIQAGRGYRVSEDALILAWFFRPRPKEFILDAGTGCGVIAFVLAAQEPGATVVGLEIQKGLSGRAGRGVKLNKLEERVSVVRGDLCRADSFFRPHTFDAVVCNPPYHGEGSGRISRLEERALARHQLMMPLSELFRVSSQLLRDGGRLTLIYPSEGWERICSSIQEAGFKPSRMLWIHPREGAAPRHVCVESLLTARAPKPIEESLILYSGQGTRSPEARAILEGSAIRA